MNEKYDRWRCARCRRWFGVLEPMHACYQKHPTNGSGFQ